MSQPSTIDGGVIGDLELAALVRRTAAELRPILSDVDAVRAKQLDAVVSLLETVALRLTTPAPSTTTLDGLADLLAAGDAPEALNAAREVAAVELARLAEPNWDLFA